MTTKRLSTPDIIPLKQTKKAAVLAAVEHFHGNIPLAAEKLEIPVRTLYRKLKEYGVDTKGRPRQERNL
jgi:transcriptional regulator of acetoin/glycerol metabolism